jgi:diguanylate cyclase (GGDEF)-like protein
VLIVATVFPVLALTWRPTLVAGAAMLLAVLVTTETTPHAIWNGREPLFYLGQTFVALFAGGVALYFRRRSLKWTATTTSRLESAAVTDALTGTYNRFGVDALGAELVARAHMEGRSAFALFLDINGLKAVNDARGHDQGDHVIRAVSQAARAVLRDGDLLGRWGGDEFVIVGRGDIPDPVVIGRRIRDELARTGDDELWADGVSVGGASGMSDYTALITAADADMYRRRASERGTTPSA